MEAKEIILEKLRKIKALMDGGEAGVGASYGGEWSDVG